MKSKTNSTRQDFDKAQQGNREPAKIDQPTKRRSAYFEKSLESDHTSAQKIY